MSYRLAKCRTDSRATLYITFTVRSWSEKTLLDNPNLRSRLWIDCGVYWLGGTIHDRILRLGGSLQLFWHSFHTLPPPGVSTWIRGVDKEKRFFLGVTQNDVFLLIGRILAQRLNKGPGEHVKITVQFNMSRGQFDQWRDAIERLGRTSNMEIVFPNLDGHYRQWYENSRNWWKLTAPSTAWTSKG